MSRAATFHRDFRVDPSIDGLATKYAWDRGTIINGESQFYLDPAWTPKWVPFSFDDRGLSITARQTPDEHAETGMPYVSGVITSNGAEPFSQRYGRWEVVATLPDATGAFVAPLWLLPMDWSALHAQYPDESVLPEIDVCENVGEARAGIYHITAHTRRAGGPELVAHSKRVETGVDLAAGPHAYAVEWTPGWLIFLFDGAEVWRFPTPPDMHDERHFLCNFAVGGDWAGAPDPEDYPASMIIESITVLAPLDESGQREPAPTDAVDLTAARAAVTRYARWLASDPAACASEDVTQRAVAAVRLALAGSDVDVPGHEFDAARAVVAGYARDLATDAERLAHEGVTRAAILSIVDEIAAPVARAPQERDADELQTPPAAPMPRVIDPPPGATLTGDTQRFTFEREPGDLVGYWLGSKPGADDVDNTGDLRDDDVIETSDIPTDGRRLHLRTAASRDGGPVEHADLEYVAAGAARVTPAPDPAAPPVAPVDPGEMSWPEYAGQNWTGWPVPAVGEAVDAGHGIVARGVMDIQGKALYPRHLSEDAGGTYATHEAWPPTDVVLVSTGEVVDRLDYSRHRWSQSVPGRAWGLRDGTLYRRDIGGEEVAVCGGLGDTIGRGEGGLSVDDTLVTIAGRGVQVVDTTSGEVIATRSDDDIIADARRLGIPGGDIDWVSASASGRYIVVAIRQAGYLRYDRLLGDALRIGDGNLLAQHGDLGLLAGGQDGLASLHWNAILHVDLDNPGRVCRVPSPLPPYGHASMTATGRPGMCFQGAHADHGAIVAVLLDPSRHTGVPDDTDSDYIGRTVAPDDATGLVRYAGHSGGSSGDPPSVCGATRDGRAVYVQRAGRLIRLERPA